VSDRASLVRRPLGQAALIRYRTHHAGVDLYRAYSQRRKADQRIWSGRRAQIIAKMEGAAGVPTAEVNALVSELIMIDILSELDPIVRSLLNFCKRTYAQDEQLSNLRSALRIGRSSPHDVKRLRNQIRAVALWSRAYSDMHKKKTYQSESVIAKQIAEKLHINSRSAIRYWHEFKKREPWQAEWIDQIIALSRVPKR
jgi:hypothetical protein